jgi:[acyl-carrier-protein] S-malonyltransferase
VQTDFTEVKKSSIRVPTTDCLGRTTLWVLPKLEFSSGPGGVGVSQIELKQQVASAAQHGHAGFLFPGQGSQYLGMLSDIASGEAVISDTFAEASESVSLDLWSLAQKGPAEAQALTENTQPLILTASVALYRLWLQRGGRVPSVLAGHSLGEFSALVAAECLAFGDAVQIVRLRGQAMQAAVPVGTGAMAAVLGLADDTINTICADVSVNTDTQVLAVNFNSPGQVVIAGHAGAVENASLALKSAGAKRVLSLPVSAPFHTPLMQPAAVALSDALENVELADAQVPVISNVNARPHTDSKTIAQLLVQQVVAPVQWTSCVQTMIEMGCADFVECGPGKVLSGLMRRIDRSKPCYGIESPAALLEALNQPAEVPLA